MSPYLRKVKTASGATVVQVVVNENGVRRIVEHLGSAHDEAELAALMYLGHQRLLAGQQVLDLGSALDGGGQVPSHEPGDGGSVRRPAIISRRSGWLVEAIKAVYARLGLGEAVGGDRAFEQMVAARLIEPTSKGRHSQGPVRDRLAGPGPPQHPASLPGPGPGAGLPRGDLSGPVRSRHRQWGGWPCACRRHHLVLRGRA